MKSWILQRQPRGAFPSFVCFSFCALVRSPEEPIRAILHAQSAKKPLKKDRPVQTGHWHRHWPVGVMCWSELWLKVWFGVIFKFGEGSYSWRDDTFQRCVWFHQTEVTTVRKTFLSLLLSNVSISNFPFILRQVAVVYNRRCRLRSYTRYDAAIYTQSQQAHQRLLWASILAHNHKIKIK